MGEKVVYLHGQPGRIGQYLRVGMSGHRQLETLLGSGRMPAERVVIEAGAARRQEDLISALKEKGCELVLDSNAAELSTIGRYEGAVREAPWALAGGVLQPGHFMPGTNHDVVSMVARFAVEHGFNAVLAPAHMLEDSTDAWLAVDRAACETLRRVLDAEGGRHVSIDYPLMMPYASVRDPAQRRALVTALEGLPLDNLWLRVSGFGADASATALRRYIASVADFQRLGYPIVADGVGGLAAMAIVAFGAAGGVAHGVAEKERFDASGWRKPRTQGGGGSEKRLLMLGLDRLFSVRQVDTLMKAPGARRLLSCNEPTCCARGLEDTLKDPKAHYLRQRAKQVAALSAVPEARRAQHFLDHDLADADRVARKAAQLKVGDGALSEMLRRTSVRLDRMRPVLDDLRKTMDGAERSKTPQRRPTANSGAAQGTR